MKNATQNLQNCEPLSRKQTKEVFNAAALEMDKNISLSWSEALVVAVERAHKIGVKS